MKRCGVITIRDYSNLVKPFGCNIKDSTDCEASPYAGGKANFIKFLRLAKRETSVLEGGGGGKLEPAK